MRFKKCLKCGKKVSKNCKFGYCNGCRDRSGDKNPFYGKSHERGMIEKTKKKLSKISKELWKNEDYRNKIIEGVSKPRREGFKKEQSERVKRWYQNNPGQRSIRSINMKKSWMDGKIEPNVNSVNESRLERELRREIKRLLPGRKVQKKTIKIDGRWFYPDIIIDNCVIVEFYGNYWHANPRMYEADDIVARDLKARDVWDNDKERVSILKNNGFKVFIVWQCEYENNEKLVIQKIIKCL